MPIPGPTTARSWWASRPGAVLPVAFPASVSAMSCCGAGTRRWARIASTGRRPSARFRLQISLRQIFQCRLIPDRNEAVIDAQVAGAGPVNDVFVDAFAGNADQVADLPLREPDLEP